MEIQMSFTRRLARKQEQAAKKQDPKAQAMELLKTMSAQLDDTQTALYQVLGELDRQDLEIRRQRAVSLRMMIEMVGGAEITRLSTNQNQIWQDPIQAYLEKEEQYRAEYDAIFAIARGLMERQQQEVEKS